MKFESEKNFLLIQRYIIRNIGFWPGSDDIKDWQIAFAIFCPSIVLFIAIFQLWFCLENINNLLEFLRGFTPAMTLILTACKILSIVWKRKEFKDILDFLHNAFVNGKNKFCDIESY